jgi:hypothetical protein
MNKEFLHDYERKEIQRQTQHYKDIQKFEPTKLVGYPPPSRFKQCNEPLVICDGKAYNQTVKKYGHKFPLQEL